jgi:hypothetical protein
MSAKKKGKKIKSLKNGELNDTEKLKLKSHEADSLKGHLAHRNDLIRKSAAANDEIKDMLFKSDSRIEELELNHKASNAYLTHQYKTLQQDMTFRVHRLEMELFESRKQLKETQHRLQNEIEEKKKIIKENDELITEMNQKIEKIQVAYQNAIFSTLDQLLNGFNKRKLSWKREEVSLMDRNKLTLAELGLNFHDI